MTTKRNCCRACGASTSVWLDLPAVYPSGFVPIDFDYSAAKKVPLSLIECKRCYLVQSAYTVSQDDMYKQYWYESGLNESMRDALLDVVTSAMKRVLLLDGDAVLDIGCNDGTMLSFYPKKFRTIGFDPSANLADKASKNCSKFVNDYFPSKNVQSESCKIITTIAMFYDLEDPSTFVNELKKWLHKGGVWVIQLADLKSMLVSNAFDNIVHEHLEHWSLMSLKKFLNAHDICVFDVEHNLVNGGSIRLYCGHQGMWTVSESVARELATESYFIGDKARDKFGIRIRESIDKICAVAHLMQSRGSKIAAIGASTKGNTFLQLAGLDGSSVLEIGEVNPAKYGLRTIGSNIPIVSEQLLLCNPDIEYLLVLPWHFISGMINKCDEFLDRGGNLLCAMPTPRVIFKDARTGEVKHVDL